MNNKQPFEARWASGLRGEIVAVIGDKPKEANSEG